MNDLDDLTGRQAGELDAELKLVRKELEDLERLSGHNAQKLLKQARRWRRRSLVLGLGAGISAAGAGVSGLSDAVGLLVVSLIALLAAVLTAAQTTVNASQTSQQAHETATGFYILQTEARLFRQHDVEQGSIDVPTARRRLEELLQRRNQLLATSPENAFYLTRADDGRGLEESARALGAPSATAVKPG